MKIFLQLILLLLILNISLAKEYSFGINILNNYNQINNNKFIIPSLNLPKNIGINPKDYNSYGIGLGASYNIYNNLFFGFNSNILFNKFTSIDKENVLIAIGTEPYLATVEHKLEFDYQEVLTNIYFEYNLINNININIGFNFLNRIKPNFNYKSKIIDPVNYEQVIDFENKIGSIASYNKYILTPSIGASYELNIYNNIPNKIGVNYTPIDFNYILSNNNNKNININIGFNYNYAKSKKILFDTTYKRDTVIIESANPIGLTLFNQTLKLDTIINDNEIYYITNYYQQYKKEIPAIKPILNANVEIKFLMNDGSESELFNLNYINIPYCLSKLKSNLDYKAKKIEAIIDNISCDSIKEFNLPEINIYSDIITEVGIKNKIINIWIEDEPNSSKSIDLSVSIFDKNTLNLNNYFDKNILINKKINYEILIEDNSFQKLKALSGVINFQASLGDKKNEINKYIIIDNENITDKNIELILRLIKNKKSIATLANIELLDQYQELKKLNILELNNNNIMKYVDNNSLIFFYQE